MLPIIACAICPMAHICTYVWCTYMRQRQMHVQTALLVCHKLSPLTSQQETLQCFNPLSTKDVFSHYIMHVGYNERHILIGLKLLIFLCLVGSWWYRTAALFLYGLHTWKLVTCWSFPSFKITYGRGHHLHTLYICVPKQCTSRWWSHSADESNKELLWYPELY